MLLFTGVESGLVTDASSLVSVFSLLHGSLPHELSGLVSLLELGILIIVPSLGSSSFSLERSYFFSMG